MCVQERLLGFLDACKEGLETTTPLWTHILKSMQNSHYCLFYLKPMYCFTIVPYNIWRQLLDTWCGTTWQFTFIQWSFHWVCSSNIFALKLMKYTISYRIQPYSLCTIITSNSLLPTVQLIRQWICTIFLWRFLVEITFSKRSYETISRTTFPIMIKT